MISAPAPAPTQRPPASRRRRLLVAATLAVALCAGYLATTIGHRLDHGASRWHGADAQTRIEDSATEVQFGFEPGRQITFGASIRNPGPWPVTITDIAVNDGPADRHVFKIANLAVNPADSPATAAFDPTASAPFRSITVASGAELPVFVTITIPNVEMAAGSGLVFDDLAVDYVVLGLPRHQRVPLGFRLSVRSVNGYVPR